jgi:PKD repeat protein
VDTATNDLINDGVATAVAAGNGNFIGRQADACNYSPARVPAAMTISATDSSDRKASWANYGNCVDWFAPGVSITSSWYTSNTATNTISGTSMASPHAAGVAALYLEANPSALPNAVRNAIYDATTKGVVTSSSTANNHLLYSAFIAGGGGGATNSPPAASFTEYCTGLTCTFTDTSTDSDGSVVTWSWIFDDGSSSTTQSPTYTYAAAGSYTVSLTVTDDDGASSTASRSVTVAEASAITLSAVGYKLKGVQHADLDWSGANSGSVDVYRDGLKITTTSNDGEYTDLIGKKGGGSYVYKICEAGTTTCSPEVTVSF